jgi:hypothetical protein
MYRIVGLAVAAVLLAGCGQYGFPGARAAGAATVVETTYTQVAVAPSPVVVHEVRYEPQPAVVNTNTNTTTVAAQPAVDQVVVMQGETRHRGYRHSRPPVIRPILHRLFEGPRGHQQPPPRWRGRPDRGGRRQEPPENNERNRPNHGPGGRKGGRGGRG